jgi:uncharacterized repeat protein (TIGR03809 family)
MTYRQDVARGRNIVARWCDLAERRLQYLLELSETGRWRRYHSERDFLENLQEARTAVTTWRDLLTREASRDNSAIDMSWLDRCRPVPAPAETLRDRLRQLQPPPLPRTAEPPPRGTSAARIFDVFSDQALSARRSGSPSSPTSALEQAANEVAGLASKIAANQQRYPSVRRAL